jgi:hypothetical protein
MKHSALRGEYVNPGHRQGPVSRQTIALAALLIVVLFGNKAVDVLGAERDIVLGTAAILVASGAVAGAFFHPVRRIWWRGSLSGVLVACGAFAAHRFYGRVRPEQFGHEFAVVALVGAIPGIALYYVLMRGQAVGGNRGEGG